MKTYQRFFNKLLGYRSDYKASFWKYLEDIFRRYILAFYYYTDKGYHSVEVIGPRGGYTGKFKQVYQEKTTETYRVILIPHYIGLYVKFNWSWYFYFDCTISVGIEKLKSCLEISFKRNTA